MTQQPTKSKFLEKIKIIKVYKEEITWAMRIFLVLGVAYMILMPLFGNKTIYQSYPTNPQDSSKFVNNYNIFIIKKDNDSLDVQKIKDWNNINNASDSAIEEYIADFIRNEKNR